MNVTEMSDTTERVERRRLLLKLIKETYPDKQGAVLFCSGFEKEREQFYQDSSFEYFFGLQEPAAVAVQQLDGDTTLYLPNYQVDRTAWLPETFDAEMLASLAIDKVAKLGQAINGYSTGPFYTAESLEALSAVLKKQCDSGQFIFTPLSNVSQECRWVVKQLCQFVPDLEKQLIDCSPLIAQLRREKSQRELEYLYYAAEITTMAQQAAAGVIKKGINEADVQAAVEYVYTESGATRAFASVVGSGKNSTVLHYVDNKATLPAKGLVVVDIGASFNHYCSDVTRTYPISGIFSERQKKVYQDVLDCQLHVASVAKPGMYLSNKEEPEKCLNTIAHNFLQERGYEVKKEFPHGIGHFVGLDVHDVGDYKNPLAPGDIITIEPGIYLRDEELGVRIEDVYWVVKEGVVCLTDQVPKKPEEVQNFMKASRFIGDPEQPKSGIHEH